jgi:hypothetical protein
MFNVVKSWRNVKFFGFLEDVCRWKKFVDEVFVKGMLPKDSEREETEGFEGKGWRNKNWLMLLTVSAFV